MLGCNSQAQDLKFLSYLQIICQLYPSSSNLCPTAGNQFLRNPIQGSAVLGFSSLFLAQLGIPLSLSSSSLNLLVNNHLCFQITVHHLSKDLLFLQHSLNSGSVFTCWFSFTVLWSFISFQIGFYSKYSSFRSLVSRFS